MQIKPPIYLILKNEGFARLPKRNKEQKLHLDILKAEKSKVLPIENQEFKTATGGLLCFLPYDKIYKAINNSLYRNKIYTSSTIYPFVYSLMSNSRYSADDMWCMDRGMGLFAGFTQNNLFSSYSDRVTKNMNVNKII